MSNKLTNIPELNAKQERFCHEYLVDFNGTQAAIRSGYSVKTATAIARENLTKPHIQKRIRQLSNRVLDRVDVKVEDVLSRLIKVAFADIKFFIKWDETGNVTFFPSDNVDGELISGFTSSDTLNGKRFHFKLHDKLKALEMLGKYLNIFKETQDEDKKWLVIIKDYDGKEDQLRKDLKQGLLNKSN